METEATINKAVIVKKRWSEGEKRTILDRYSNTTGISIKRFCKQNHISDSAFYSWRKKYIPRADKFKKKASGFLPISVSQTPASSHLFAEVGGIRIYQPVGPEYLKSLAS